MKKPKSGTRRSQAKYPALRPELNPKTRFELLDYDYLDKLNDEEKAWLNAFTEEYTHANMKHPGKKLHTRKKQKKDCYDRNNSRNRCIWTRVKAAGMTVDIDSVLWMVPSDEEDLMEEQFEGFEESDEES